MTAKWKVLGDSVQGVLHQKTATPCQDASAYNVFYEGKLIIVVADGAGSASYSADGASCAVEKTLHYLEKEIDAQKDKAEISLQQCQDWVFSAFEIARSSVISLAEKAQHLSRDYACTLTVVLVVEDYIVAGQIGDGTVVVEEQGGFLRTLVPPQRGEYANETYFLTDEKMEDYIEIRAKNLPVSSIIVMTDGLLRLALDMQQDTPYEGFFRPLIKFVRGISVETGRAKLHDFLNSKRVCARTHDDKTLVLAVKD